MNKEEKVLMTKGNELLQELNQLMKDHTERLKNPYIPPVLFSADCEKCGKPTVHISHIVGGNAKRALAWLPMAYTSMTAPNEPLRTCLQCGETVYKE